MPSIIALAPGFNFMIFLAQNTPRKKAIMVAATPVFMEIHNGVQFISLRNSPILFCCILSCLFCLFSGIVSLGIISILICYISCKSVFLKYFKSLIRLKILKECCCSCLVIIACFLVFYKSYRIKYRCLKASSRCLCDNINGICYRSCVSGINDTNLVASLTYSRNKPAEINFVPSITEPPPTANR